MTYFINREFYEGFTEVIALLSDDDAEVREQGYRGGGALSGLLVAYLAGEGRAVGLYLKGDDILLGSALNENLKSPNAAGELFSPSVIVIFDDYYDNSLDVIHNSFKNRNDYNIDVTALLERAWKRGIKEKVAHAAVEWGDAPPERVKKAEAEEQRIEDGAILLTTHLFLINDKDDPPKYLFNAVGECPDVYRFGKIGVYDEVDGQKVFFPTTESFGFIMTSRKMADDARESMIDPVLVNLPLCMTISTHVLKNC